MEKLNTEFVKGNAPKKRRRFKSVLAFNVKTKRKELLKVSVEPIVDV